MLMRKYSANVFARGKTGRTRLIYAAINGCALKLSKFMRQIRKKRIDFADNKYGFTALHWAVLLDHHECVQLLLEHRADLTVTGRLGHTPMYMVGFDCEKFRMRCVLDLEYLLLRNTKSPRRKRSSCTETVQILLRRGADAIKPSKKGDLPFFVCHKRECWG